MTRIDSSVNNMRLAKNTILLYIRMLFLMLVNLYTSRVLLQALGVEDYGLYNAVAGFIAMFSMVSGSLTSAISRFITFTLGAGDEQKLERVFCTSIIIQLFLAAIVLILVEVVGVWFLNSYMTIPHGRENAANWVLQLALITFVINIVNVPYNACIIAHEKMSAFAYIGIFEGCANLSIAFLVLMCPIDSLIFYALLMCAVAFVTRMIYTFYCNKKFKECRFHWIIDRETLHEMFGFAGWNFVGSISGLLRSQGINLLFNVYNGPIVNAARGLAVQVSTAITKFSSSFYTAVQPQITKSYASGDIHNSCTLALRSSRLAFFLLLLLSVPVVFEANFLLSLWLEVVPEHAASFVQIIVVYSLFESWSQPLIQMMLATGDIKKYQIVVGGINLLNFPIAWIILYLGYAPEIAQFSVVIFTFLALFFRAQMLKYMIGFPVKKFYVETVLKSSFVLILCCIVPFVICYYMQSNWTRFFICVLLTEFVSVTIIAAIGLTDIERQFVLSKVPFFKRFYHD